MFRRTGSLAAILACVLAMMWSGGRPAIAQAETAPVTIHLQTCDVTGSADSVLIQESSETPSVLRNCVPGWLGDASSLQIDGNAPDAVTETEATWDAVPIGAHFVIAPGLSAETDISVASGGVELWAFWAKHADPVPGTGTVIANLMVCDVAGTADSVTLMATNTPPDTLTNCREGWPGADQVLTLDGEAPEAISDNVAVWYDVPYGDHFASAGMMDSRGDLVITLDSDTVEFWAAWDKHVTPGGMVQISVRDCGVATGDASWIGADGDAPAGFENCTAGNIDSREWGLRIDGTTPDWFDANGAYWTLANGPHVATTTSGASYEFTVSGATVNLVAYFGPDGAAVGGTDATSTAQPAVTGAAVTALPKTGTGSVSHDLPMAAMIVLGASLVTMMVLAGSLAMRTRRMP